MRKLGEVMIERKAKNSGVFENVWGDTWDGKNGEIWGVIKFKIFTEVYEQVRGAVSDYNETVEEGEREYRIKTKRKKHKEGKAPSVIKCYIRRPCNGDGMLSEALEELDGYEWREEDLAFRINIECKDFSYVLEDRVIKEL